jgi:ElaB/YqjD/DUF883 family membrane-anchored ribosome-binding protein
MAKGNQLNTPTGAAMAQSEVTESERSAEEIRQDIAARRESITETVDRLSDRVQQTFDWRTYVSNYPVIAVGIAAGLGMLVSGILKPRTTPTERVKDALADCFEDFTDRFRSQLDDVTPRRPTINQTIKAAATGLLIKGATEFVRNRLTGFNDQTEHDHNRAGSRNRVSSMTATKS